MLNKIASLVLVVAVVTALCGTSALASNTSNPDKKADTAIVLSDAPAKKEVRPNEQLKNSMLKLVADAKSGKVPAAKSQIQPAQSNHLSKGKKIAIGVGIAIAVIAVILIAKSPVLNDGR
jgi:hypothetical protein